MSTTKHKPVKNKRDIFEAANQPYGTEDYRKNMVGHWISYQQIEPASMHEPTVLESNAPSATQKSRPTPLSKSQQHNAMHSSNANEHQRMKKRKHEQNYASKFVDFDAQPPLGIDRMDEPFFAFDVSNERKIRSSGNNNNNNTYYDQNNRILNDPLPSKTQNRTQKYGISTGRDECDTMKLQRHHHQSQHHPIEVRPSSKRRKSSNQHFGMNDFVEFDDFQFNFDDGPGEEQQQQLVRKEKKSTDHRLHGKIVDKSHPHDAFTDFDLFADAFDEDGQNDRQPTSQFIYKRFKERSYAELMGTTPAWQKGHSNLRKGDPATGLGKNIDDSFLFKHPAAIGGAKQNAVEILDLHDERGSHRRHHHRRRDHREQHAKNQLVDQQYVISHEIEKFIPKPSDASNELYVLKTGHNRTATATSTQPNTFYIKCNNLTIKHD